MTLRAAVVGSAFGGRIHVPALRQAGFDVVALVGKDAERTKRRAERLEIEHGCASLSDALEIGVDAVTIASPPATHASLAIEAAGAGVHVLCEKPFTLDAAEAEAVVAAAESADVVGLIGHEFRWGLAQATMAWAVEMGLVGTPKLFVSTSFLSMLRTFPMSDWFYDPQQGGGWLGASGSHRIDALRELFGAVAAVSAGLPTVSDPALAVDDSFNLRVAMASGVDVAIVQSAAAHGPGSAQLRLAGTAGTLWAQDDVVWLATDEHLAGTVVEPPDFLSLPDVEALAVGSLAAMTRMELPPYIRLAEAFRREIERRPAASGPRPATFADGLAEMHVLDAIRASAAQGGQWVSIKEGSTHER